MKILMVLLTNEYPPDVRVEGEVEALEAEGHSVYMLTVKDGAAHPWTPRTFRLPRLLKRHLSYPLLCIILFPTLLYLTLKHGIRRVHVHDVLHAVPVVFICKLLGLKVTSDIHEDFVDALRFRSRFVKNPLIRWAFRAMASLFSLLERVIIFSDDIITVSPMETERWIKLGAKPHRVTTLPNTMSIPRVKSLNLKSTEPAIPTLTYVGGFTFHRGLETLVEAMKHIDKYPVRLELIGDGHMMPYLKEQSADMDNVTLTGYLPFEEAMERIAKCTIFVIPYPRTRQTDISSPHKLYQAMALKKPLIVSDCPMLERVVNVALSGLTFRAGSHTDLAEKITQLLDSPFHRTYYGKRGRDYTNHFTWEKESTKLLSIYGGRQN